MNFRYIICVAMFSLFVTSCGEDDLALFPNDGIATELGLLNSSDFENALKGVYVAFLRSGYYGPTSSAASIYFIPDVISDDVVINSNGRRSREDYYDWRYDEDNSSETFWLSAYKVVQRANLILENIDVLEEGAFKNNVRGEALAARGIAHFDLAKLYADSPATRSTNSLGVPYVTSTDSGALPNRNSLDDTYSSILADLNEANGLVNSDNGVGRINKNVVSALLSRVHLFMGNYSEVITAANAVTGVSEVGRDDVLAIWKDASNASIIWKLPIIDSDDISVGVSWLQESPDGIRSEYNVDFALFALYGDNDIRKQVYFETSGFSGVDYNHIVKYRGRLSGDANLVDAKVIRYSEVALNKAEALAEMGQDGPALVALDEVRSNRYSSFVSGGETGQALKDAVALERRLELAFEGHRFFDLKRKGLPIVRSNFGDEAGGNGEQAEFKTLEASDTRFNMAIGANERNANENIEQNSGY
ncbi:MAG: hypothetical protein ACI9FN_000726 [Saprospiraceae bacterium]|jgi:hypothetical protein